MGNLIESIKNRIDTGNTFNQSLLLNKINAYSYISFDIFDTLLKRNVTEPSDIFELMEIRLGQKYVGFKEKRIVAEKIARKKKNKNEITIHDIYYEFSEKNATEIERLIETECCVEREVLTVNPEILDVFKKCVAENKRVFFLSDMYLPKDFITEVLSNLGITGYEKLYVSCDVQQTKSSGDLFKLFLSDININAKNVLHIGDSRNSDYRVPKKIGIEAIRIPKIIKRSQYRVFNYNSDIRMNCLNAFINNTEPDINDLYYKFGYEKFGMFLWGYIKWLYQEAKKNGIDKLYFFSRDGFIMKKAFDICYYNSSIDTFYLEVSRRSLRVPILWMDCKFITVLNTLSPSKLISIKTIFDGVGLDINSYSELLEKYGFNKSSTFDRNEIMNDKMLLNLYEQLQPDIIKVSKSEYELLKGYINKNKLSGKFAIVDIGWSGGMQRYLEQALDKLSIKHSISGYYIGIASYYKRNKLIVHDLNLNGYLFDFNNNNNETDKRSSFVGLFETLFLEQGGSVKNYSKKKDFEEITANRYTYEYIQNGIETDEYLKVKRIQNGALDFISNIFKNQMLNSIKYTADELFAGLYQTGANPKKIDLEMFADFRFYDEGETVRLASPKSLLYYLTHLRVLKKDFLMSRWKVGFMKKTLKINLPYVKLYNYLLRLK